MPALRALFLPILLVGAGCGQSALGVMPGVINDTRNLSLRRAILAQGKGRICDEVQGRSLPIRPRDDAPIIGRFIPLQCYARDLPNGEIYLQLGGRGYVWTSASQRVGFEASVGVNYDTDFQLDGSTVYLYLRPRAATAPAFATRVVENPQAAFFGGMATAPNGQKMTDAFGSSLMSSQIARGFTVIRRADGSVEMGLGVIPPGAHPAVGIADLGRDKPVLINDRSELRANQRDFVPIMVPSGSRLTLHVGVAGPGVDVLLVPRLAGDAWLSSYATQAVTTPPPAAPLLDEPVDAGPLWRRTLSVPPGAYYLVLDNTATAGRRAPAAYGDQPVVVSYGAELE
ncbi:Hypothetical protein A7982_08274 [Minicystis rosea]|nr:Hypothetical protein A7982_08274 [Minicystis rosea]